MFSIDYNLLLISANVLLVAFIVITGSQLRGKVRFLIEENRNMKSDLNALCRGTANVDRRLDYIDAQVKRVHERQESMESSDVAKREYDHAIRAIKNGTSFERLVNVHGLSNAEAKLLVSLHGEVTRVS